jgi:hypothetical protein
MEPVPRWIGVVCCLSVLTLFDLAQTRKAGLWELTTTTTWQPCQESQRRDRRNGMHGKDER